MRQGAASKGKLGETFRGNRFFLLMREAPAHGRDETMPKGFLNTDSGEELTAKNKEENKGCDNTLTRERSAREVPRLCGPTNRHDRRDANNSQRARWRDVLKSISARSKAELNSVVSCPAGGR
jgi:hypothetical protein